MTIKIRWRGFKLGQMLSNRVLVGITKFGFKLVCVVIVLVSALIMNNKGIMRIIV